MEFYWIDDTHLRVNGEKMLPEEAYKKYPKDANKIKAFVKKSKTHEEKLFDFITSRRLESNTFSDEEEYSVKECCSKIKVKIEEIFKHLNIEGDSIQKQKRNAYVLFEYVIKNSNYDYRIMEEKRAVANDMFTQEVIDIYRCLCENRSVCTSDAAALSLMYRCAGIDSRHLTIAEKGDIPQGVHEVVKMRFGDEIFICDPTLVRTCLEQGNIPDISPSVFAFTPNKFFEILYPSKEIKVEHVPYVL